MFRPGLYLFGVFILRGAAMKNEHIYKRKYERLTVPFVMRILTYNYRKLDSEYCACAEGINISPGGLSFKYPKVIRDGDEKTFKVKIAKRDDDPISSGHTQSDKHEEDVLGIRVADLTPETARRFQTDETRGIIVIGVEPGSKGYNAGVRVGDIIKEVNHKSVETAEEFQSVIKKIKEDEAVQLFIQRINTGFLVLKLTK